MGVFLQVIIFNLEQKNEKDFERTCQNLVNYVGILRNIDF